MYYLFTFCYCRTLPYTFQLRAVAVHTRIGVFLLGYAAGAATSYNAFFFLKNSMSITFDRRPSHCFTFFDSFESVRYIIVESMFPKHVSDRLDSPVRSYISPRLLMSARVNSRFTSSHDSSRCISNASSYSFRARENSLFALLLIPPARPLLLPM